MKNTSNLLSSLFHPLLSIFLHFLLLEHRRLRRVSKRNSNCRIINCDSSDVFDDHLVVNEVHL